MLSRLRHSYFSLGQKLYHVQPSACLEQLLQYLVQPRLPLLGVGATTVRNLLM